MNDHFNSLVETSTPISSAPQPSEFETLVSKFDPQEWIQDLDAFDAANARGRYGRPKVTLDDGTTKERRWRPSTLAKKLDGVGGLVKWAQGMALLGGAEHPELIAKARDINYEGDSWKSELYDLGETAKESASVNQGADYGSLIHELTAAVDQDEDRFIPPEVAGAVTAYQSECARLGLRRVAVEFGIDNPGVDAAGTCDGAWLGQDGITRLGDIKTSSTSGPLSWAIQMAIYHSGHMYDPATKKHRPWPADLDQHTALIFHIKYEARDGEDRCDVLEIDLKQAADLLLLVLEVEEWRATAKQILTPVNYAFVAPPTLTLDERVRVLVESGNQEVLAARWRAAGLPKLADATPEQETQIGSMLQEVEQGLGLVLVAPPEWRDRLRALPPDLAESARVSLLMENFEEDPTPQVMRIMGTVLAEHEELAVERAAQIEKLMNVFPDGLDIGMLIPGRTVSTISFKDLYLLEALAVTWERGLLTLTDFGEVAVAVDKSWFRSPFTRRAVLSAARAVAKSHRLPPVTKADEVLTNPVLFAGCVHWILG